MNKNINPQRHIMKLFEQKKCYQIEELHKSMNYSLISIRRFLKEIGYCSSFTHNNKWYTLKSVPAFNKNGIWLYQDIGFSKHGNLNQTILHFVEKSNTGLTAKKLCDILSVPCHSILNQMYKKIKIDRFHTSEGFYYLSMIEKKKKLQLKQLHILAPFKKIKPLPPQTAVYVLVEIIKNSKLSFFELSMAVEKKGVTASQEAIAQLFREHDLKKIPE
jgi:hypothetical protein